MAGCMSGIKRFLNRRSKDLQQGTRQDQRQNYSAPRPGVVVQGPGGQIGVPANQQQTGVPTNQQQPTGQPSSPVGVGFPVGGGGGPVVEHGGGSGQPSSGTQPTHPPHSSSGHQGSGGNPPGDSHGSVPITTPATTTGELTIALHNNTTSNTVYAYVTGSAIANNGALFLLSADGKTPYYPPSPSSNVTPITYDISIPLGAPGSITYITIPLIAGGRIWFSVGTPLQFFLNPGPGLVEPSVFNGSDPNIETPFGFCEFTFNSSQLFANISYVDFVGLPIALTLSSSNVPRQHVSGIPANGLQTIANGLRAQTAKDGQKWSSLIVNNTSGQLLRIFSPNSGMLLNPSWFSSYWTGYVQQVYAQYANEGLVIDTQAGYGNVTGRTNGTTALNFGAGGQFQEPTAGDIFSNSTGPFATGSNGEANAIIPRLAAAFNRSTLLYSSNQPDGVNPSQYYTYPITNHYARIVHEANLDGLGYAFPYDDVTPDGGQPQEGAVYSATPLLFSVAVGGNNAWVG